MNKKEKQLAVANLVLDKFVKDFGRVYTDAERNFNLGYLVALMDFADKDLFKAPDVIALDDGDADG